MKQFLSLHIFNKINKKIASHFKWGVTVYFCKQIKLRIILKETLAEQAFEFWRNFEIFYVSVHK
jgi:hypothetical protein